MQLFLRFTARDKKESDPTLIVDMLILVSVVEWFSSLVVAWSARTWLKGSPLVDFLAA